MKNGFSPLASTGGNHVTFFSPPFQFPHPFRLYSDRTFGRHYDYKASRGDSFPCLRPCARERTTCQLQIALVDNVEYVPFSAGRYDSPEEYYFRCADDRAHSREAGMPNVMRLCLRAGDAVIFEPNGLHRGRYLQDNPRRTLMISYTPRGRVLDMPLSRHPWMLEPGYFEGLSKRTTVYFEEFVEAYHEYWQSGSGKARFA
jgi:hypothetical protein